MSSPQNHGRDRERRLLHLGLPVVLFLAVGAAAAVCLAHVTRLRDKWPPEADTFYLPPSSALRVASVGHTEMFADLIHARANVYFGTQLHERVPTKWLASYLHTAIDLDPRFKRIYMAGAAMIVYNGQVIKPDMVLAANGILERGRKTFPYEWDFPFQLGFNLLYELPQDAGEDDPRVPGWRQRGVEMLREASLYEGVPYYLPNLVARMLTKNGADDLAIKHLERSYALATNAEARKQIGLKLIALRGQRFSEELERNLAAFTKMIAGRFNYAPEAFSLVAGPRITARAILEPPPSSAPTNGTR